MRITAQRLLSRIMFIVMLATFTSPSLGLGMVATHDQLSHGITSFDAGKWHDDHHHHEPHDDDAQHQDPHSSIGHLFSHLPISLFGISPLVIQPQAQPEVSFLRQPFVTVALEPPLRPPKAFLPC